jgi:hypothetical protein
MPKVILDQNSFESYMVEIVTGRKLFYIGTAAYALSYPTVQDRDMGRAMYSRILIELKKEGIPTIEEMRKRMEDTDVLPKNFYISMSVLKKNMEMNRKERDMTTYQMQQSQLDMEYEEMCSSLFDMEFQEGYILANTAETMADGKRNMFYLFRCLYKGEELNERKWNSSNEFNKSTENKFISESIRHFISFLSGLSPSVIRAVARHGEWRRIWDASKKTGSPLFEGTVSSWDRNKLSLCHWSDFYDSIYSYHTPPSEDIIYDDDKLFEWIRQTNRVNKSDGESSGTRKKGGAGETIKVATPYKVRPRRTK